MELLLDLLVTLTIVVMFSSITTSVIQFIRYRTKWMKFYLLHVGLFALFLIVSYLYYSTAQTEHALYSQPGYLILEIIIHLIIIIECVVVPKFIIHVSEIKPGRFIKLSIYTVPAFYILILISYFISDIYIHNKDLHSILEVGLMTANASVNLLFLSFYILGLMNWKHLTNKESKKGVPAFIVISFFFVFIMFFDELLPEEWLSEEYLLFQDIYFYLFSFLLFLVILTANFKRILYISNLKVKNDFPAEALKEYKITEREKDIINLLVKGNTYASIGEKLFISQKTVNAHIYNIYKKLEINNKVELIDLGLKFSDYEN